MSAYITSVGKFLPGEPIPSEEVEEYIGSVGPRSSALRDRVIANSGINTRYYALDKQQRSQHSCASMGAEAVRQAVERSEGDLEDIELLSVATSLNDVLAPGIASMVHGELGNGPCEIASFAGICNAGMAALKNAYLQVEVGEKRTAVACAVEFCSRLMKAQRFANEAHLDADGHVAMEIAFMRYMLSDGAGAVVIEDRPAPSGHSYRIEWMTLRSFANETETCMYMGMNGDGDAEPGHFWLDYPSVEAAATDGAVAMRQKIRLLPGLLRASADEYERLYGEGLIDPDRIKRVAVHYSSEILTAPARREVMSRGVPVPPEETWFSNLPSVGNVPCAAIYLMLDEIVSHDLEAGDQVLLYCPESGRRSVSFGLLTVVGPEERPA
jgi:3-oxoacyl-[acyl-carrier-protein] synthase-3